MEALNLTNGTKTAEKNSVFTKLKKFFSEHPKSVPAILYSGLTLFILTIFTIALATFKIFPFGDATMSSYDMSAQIAPFIEHFFDVIDGKSSLFYSYAIAGGADVFGTLAYCCVSPFTFLFLIFGKGNVYYATAIVLPLKIVCVAISGLLYIRKRFSNIHPAMQFVLALSYAFSGYLFVSNTYINWVDLMIYLPFVALGFYRIKTEDKKLTFIIALSLMIYTCFSISCFSLLLIFPIIVLYCLFAEERVFGKKLLVNSIWALALAIMVSMPILVPALKAFLVSGRKTGIFENINASYSYEALYKKSSYLFTDSFTLFFTLVFFAKNGIKDGKCKFLALAAVVLFVPVLIDESMNLLNFGSYMSYSLRFGFLNGFYFFYIACLFFGDWKTERSYTERVAIKRKNALLTSSLIGVLTVAFCAGLVIFFKILQGTAFVQWFAPRFAHSEGGLEATAIIFGCVALIALLGIFFVNSNRMPTSVLAVCLLITTLAQSTFYGFSMVSGNYMDPVKFKQVGALTNYVHELEDDDDLRVKMCSDILTSCMPLSLHTNSYSVFSSVIDNRNFIAPNFFSYGGNGKNQMRSYGGRFIGDVIFGNEYFISDGSYSSGYEKYIEKVDGYKIVDENGNLVDTGSYILYRNKYALPHAFAVKNAETLYTDGVIAGYDGLLKMLGGEECGVDEMDFSITEYKPGIYKIAVKRTAPGDYYITSNFKNVAEVRYARGSNIEEKNYQIPENNTVFLGHTSTSTGTTYIYYQSLGEPLTEEDIRESCCAFRVKDQSFMDIYELASTQTVEFDAEPNLLTAKLTANDGEYLFLNYVALSGHKAYVNGKLAQLEENELGFMLVKLDAGYNEVEIIYQSPYLKLIILGVLIALAFVSIYLLINKKFKVVFEKLQSFIYIAGISLAGLLIAFYIAMPTVVCLVKNLKLLVTTIISKL